MKAYFVHDARKALDHIVIPGVFQGSTGRRTL